MAEKKDLIDGPLGPEAKYDIDFVDGKIKVDIGYAGAQLEGGFYLKLDLIQMLEIAASKTDNKIDDQAVALIRGML